MEAPSHLALATGPSLVAVTATSLDRGDDLVVALLAAIVTIVLGAQAQVLAAGALGDRLARDAGRTWDLGRRIDRTGTIIVPGLLALASGVAIGWSARLPMRRDELAAGRRVVLGLVPSSTAAAVAGVALVAGSGWADGPDAALVDPSAAATVATVALLQAVFWLLPVPPLPGGEVVAALLGDDRGASWQRRARGPVAPWGLGVGALLVVTGVGDGLRRVLGG